MKKVLNIGWVVFGIMIAIYGVVIFGQIAGKSFEGFGGTIIFLAAGYIGAVIGNAMRLYAMPDAYFTDGTLIGNIKTRLFWQHGPQLIGFFIAHIVVLKILKSSVS